MEKVKLKKKTGIKQKRGSDKGGAIGDKVSSFTQVNWYYFAQTFIPATYG